MDEKHLQELVEWGHENYDSDSKQSQDNATLALKQLAAWGHTVKIRAYKDEYMAELAPDIAIAVGSSISEAVCKLYVFVILNGHSKQKEDV